MKPTTAQITAFLNKPDARVRVALLYGQDAGLVRERADLLAKKTVDDPGDPFRVAHLAAGAAADDPARLYDEAAAQALGGGRRLVRIQHATDGLAASLGAFLKDAPPGDSFVLIEAGELEARSKLRAACEGSDLAIVIPCYVEDSVQRFKTVQGIFESEGIKASREVLGLLAEILPPDRLAMRSEVEKLALYVREKKAVSVDDVRMAIGDAGAAATDDLVHAVADGNARRAAALLDHLLAEQVSVVAILRAAQRHFLRLQMARSFVDEGVSAKAAVEKLQPKVFWKFVEPMARQAQKWKAPAIEDFLKRLYEAEAAVKQSGTPDAALCGMVLMGKG